MFRIGSILLKTATFSDLTAAERQKIIFLFKLTRYRHLTRL
jgi:hypothetical protein